MGVIFAESLKELPFVHTLDLTDNNLSDVGLNPIIKSVISLPNLTDLNLSQNVVDGESSKALAVYLSTASCPLKRLVLQSADVDDEECQMFVASLMVSNNTELMELDLSRNIIGKSENLNTVIPDIITGGEAIADLLAANACHLQTLHLGWNMIRLDSAVELTKSLAGTTHLTYLDISYNAIGKDGGETLGKSLITNDSLRHLDISHNGINSTACFTICVGLEENRSLRTLIMDGNPIGELGFTMTSQVPLTIGDRVEVLSRNCNICVRDPEDSKVNMNAVAGRYELNMSRPFERAIMMKILSISGANKSYGIEELTLTVPRSCHVRNVKLMRCLSNNKYDTLSEKMRAEVLALRNISEIAENEDLAEQLFHEHDVDGGGSLDLDEVEALVESLGLNVERSFIEETIKKFDVDGGGVLELDEFLEFIGAQREDALSRIRELTEGYIICNKKYPKKRYIPPKSGTMRFLLADSYIAAGAKVVSSEEHENIMEKVNKCDDGKALLVEFSIKGARLRCKEAVSVYHFLSATLLAPAAVLEKLLPRLCNYSEARLFLQQTIQNDTVIIRRLRQVMGSCFDAILGYFDGWYNLNLSNVYDRICLGKLLEQSQANKDKMISKSCFQKGITGDVSQLGDWSSFRNVIMNGKPGIITPELFNPMSEKGTLHFDFSGAGNMRKIIIIDIKVHYPVRYISDTAVGKYSIISDQRVVNCLVQHDMVTDAGKAQTFNFLKEMKKDCDANYNGNGQFSNLLSEKRAKQIQYYMLAFYRTLPERPSFVLRAQQIEDSALDGKDFSQSFNIDDSFAEYDYDTDEDSDEESEGNYGEVALKRQTVIKEVSIVKASSTKPKRKSGVRRKQLMKKSTPVLIEVKKNKFFKHIVKASVKEDKQELSAEIKSMRIEAARKNRFATSWKIVKLAFEIFKRSWLRCRHLAVIVNHFFQGHIKRSKHFGSYRVELVVLLFHRLTDVQNFDLITKRLMPYEIACLYCRIGYLKLFNPMKPEGSHFLNISNREERILTKLMGALSAVEPGENWIDETFQWELEMDPIPGW